MYCSLFVAHGSFDDNKEIPTLTLSGDQAAALCKDE